MLSRNVCLQINLAPGDLRYVSEILPHQLRTFGAQVEEIQFTLDTQQSRAFRAATDNYGENFSKILHYLEFICKEFPQARISEVDYSPARVAEIAQYFVGKDVVPRKACDGSAFYAYLFGMFNARCDYILHLDSDMLFGGGSQTWVSEAVNLLEQHREIFACYPFPGPIRPDGAASKRRLTSLWDDVNLDRSCVPSTLQHLAFSYNEISTRVFIFDRRRFESDEFKVPLVRPRLRRLMRSYWINTSPYLLLEDCLTVLLNNKSLRCIGFSGSGSGMWSLHTRRRSERLYAGLRALIERVESNDVPDGQRGDFDLNDAMMDWSDVYQAATHWRRFQKELRLIAFGIADRVRN